MYLMKLADKFSLQVLLAVAIVVFSLVYFRRKPKEENISTGAEQAKDVNADREWGEWTPVKFVFPEILPCKSSFTDAKPIPYRPFRWGQYNVTMGIRDMPWSDWIELDRDFQSYFKIRNHRIHSRGEDAIRILPDRPGIVKSARHAAIELAHELANFVIQRYPNDFTARRDASGVLKAVEILPAGVVVELPPPLLLTTSLALREVSQEEAEHAMKTAALLIQDDLALMVEGHDGCYYFQGGAICLPGFWRMRDKIGLPLNEIHLSGDVPHFQDKLEHSLDRFFKRMPVHKPVIRNNYFLQVVKPESFRRTGTVPVDVEPRKEDEDLLDPLELSWSTTLNGDEDQFTHGQPGLAGQTETSPTVLPETLQFRTERQTLRRLPLSGAIVFTIRTYLVPLPQLGKEPGVPARLANAVRSWSEWVGRYKGKMNYEAVLLDYLDKCAEEQRLAGGEDLEKDKGRGYPF